MGLKTKNINPTQPATSGQLPHPVEDAKPPSLVLPDHAKPKAHPAQLPRLAFSIHETAKILGLSYITVYRLIQRGLLKSSSALRKKLIPLTEIERFLRTTTQ
jgi:excisionase family DNA binding protein